jgi:CubicO group peptidase (beta-lactamase class C family)
MKNQILLGLVLGLALYTCAFKKEADKVKEIDILLSKLEKLNKFNGTVLIAQGNEAILEKGYGFRDVEKKKANNPNSIFQIYSITKTFTSTLIFKLIEEKKIKLEDKLSKFYPNFPNGDKITIEHLLTHTSGINDNANQPNAPETEAYRVELFGKKPPHFAPGEGWSYCNGGYQLLGYIIAKVTKMPYENAIKAYIFKPLAMSNSGFDFKGLRSAEKTTAYQIFTNEIKKTAVLYDSTGPYAAGSIYSTVADLYKYYQGLKKHEIISQESLEKAFSPKTNPNYGYGWQLNTGFFKSKIVSHSGGAAGFRSNFTWIPSEEICIILLNNHENANLDYISQKIMDILHNKLAELPNEAIISVKALEKYVGAYAFKEQNLMIYTSIVDGRLALELAGQGKTTVLAQSENTFYQAEVDAHLEFQKDKSNNYQLIIKQGWGKMVGSKTESSWGLLGSATAKGWEDNTPDIKLKLDKRKKGRWVLNDIRLKKGEIKFRLDNNWNINYGDNNGDKLLDLHGKNIPVEEGKYDIMLDFSSENPDYELIKK